MGLESGRLLLELCDASAACMILGFNVSCV